MEVIKEIHQVFGEKLRLRVSGIFIQNDSILLVKHFSLGSDGILWAPPGGGLNYGETVTETLVREFKEETGLIVQPGSLLFVNEYLEDPLHAIELFFKVEVIGGTLQQGTDPELHPKKQIIQDVAFISFEELADFKSSIKHSLFETYKKTDDFKPSSTFMQNIIRKS